MKIIPGAIVSTGHVLITGPIKGTVTKADGTVVDVSDIAIEVADDEAAEIAHLVGLRYAAEGHPDDVELDDDPESPTFGQMVQREFVYVTPAEFVDYTPAEG